MDDIIVEECRSRLDNIGLDRNVFMNIGFGIHSDIRQTIRHFVVCTIVMPPAGDRYHQQVLLPLEITAPGVA